MLVGLVERVRAKDGEVLQEAPWKLVLYYARVLTPEEENPSTQDVLDFEDTSYTVSEAAFALRLVRCPCCMPAKALFPLQIALGLPACGGGSAPGHAW